jgi:hypothetical protein
MLWFLTLELPSGLVINDARLMIGPQERRWFAIPEVKQTDADGKRRFIDGKQAWRAIVEFQNRSGRQRFEEQVLGELRRQHPGLEGSR